MRREIIGAAVIAALPFLAMPAEAAVDKATYGKCMTGLKKARARGPGMKNAALVCKVTGDLNQAKAALRVDPKKAARCNSAGRGMMRKYANEAKKRRMASRDLAALIQASFASTGDPRAAEKQVVASLRGGAAARRRRRRRKHRAARAQRKPSRPRSCRRRGRRRPRASRPERSIPAPA